MVSPTRCSSHHQACHSHGQAFVDTQTMGFYGATPKGPKFLARRVVPPGAQPCTFLAISSRPSTCPSFAHLPSSITSSSYTDISTCVSDNRTAVYGFACHKLENCKLCQPGIAHISCLESRANLQPRPQREGGCVRSLAIPFLTFSQHRREVFDCMQIN
jgi:hypothetical protein